MKSLLSLSLSVVLSVTVMLGLVHAVTPNYNHARQATWQLTGELGTCSGVLIEKNKFLTAAHCFQPGDMTVNGKHTVVLKRDAGRDLMLLFVDMDCPCVPVAKSGPKLDAKVVVIGFPLDMGQTLTEGRYQGMMHDDGLFMRITAPIIFGNSGGPVMAYIDGQLRVVGITSALAVATLGGFIPNVIPHLGIASSTVSINEFLK